MAGCGMSPGILTAWAQDRLDAPARASAEAHAAGCASCRAEMARLKSLLAALRAAPVALPSAGFMDAVRRKVAVIQGAEQEAAAVARLLRSRRWWQRPWMPAAAAAALAASVSAGLWWSLAEAPAVRDPAGFPLVAGMPSVPAPEAPFALPPSIPQPPPLPLPDPLEPPGPVEPGPAVPEEAEVPARPLPIAPAFPPTPPPEELPVPSPAAEPVEVYTPTTTIPPRPVRPRGAAAGRAWLAAHQNPDGSWGELVAQENLPSRIQVTALAVLSLTESEADPTCPTCVHLALGFLQSQQDAAGMLGPPCDKRVLVQAMATSALAGIARVQPAARAPLQRAATALARLRGAEGWTKDASPGIHAVATAWASDALLRARAAGAGLPDGWERRAGEGCRRLVDRRRGTAGLIRPGDEAATGGWASTVAVGWVLESAGRRPEARALAAEARSGARTRLAAASPEEADPETLALLASWVRRDPEAFGGGMGGAIREAFLRWEREGHWRTEGASRWDSLSGPAYATALASWVLEALEPAKPRQGR